MLLRLGSLSLAAAIPALDGQLLARIAEIASTLTSLQADAVALAQDLATVAGDVTRLLGEQLAVQADVDAFAAQLTALPGAALAGVESAIADLQSGNALAALKGAALAIPDAVRASVTLAAEGPQAKLVEIGARLAAAQARVGAVVARTQALTARIAAAEGVRANLLRERAALASASLDAYVYAGPSSAFGGELDAALTVSLPSGGVALSGALVLVAQGASDWLALGKVLKVLP